jgi:hypothetical protein
LFGGAPVWTDERQAACQRSVANLLHPREIQPIRADYQGSGLLPLHRDKRFIELFRTGNRQQLQPQSEALRRCLVLNDVVGIDPVIGITDDSDA